MKINSTRTYWSALLAPAALALLLVAKTVPGSPFGPQVSPVPSSSVVNRQPPAQIAAIPPATPVPPSGSPPPVVGLPALGPVGSGISIIPPSILPVPVTEPLDPRFKSVDDHINNGEFDQATALATQLVATPDQRIAAHARFVLGQILLIQGRSAEAGRAFEDYLSRSASGSDAPSAAFALATIYQNSRDPSRAAARFEQYLRSTPDHALDGYAYLGLAKARESQGDSAGARAYQKQAIVAGLSITDESALAAKIGNGLISEGKLSEAADWFTTLANRPGLDAASRGHYRIQQANALRRLGRTTEAIAIYRQMLNEASAPVDLAAAVAALRGLNAAPDLVAIGDAYLQAGQYDLAIAAYGDYLDNNRNGSQAATARLGRGQALLLAGSRDTGIAQLQKFLEVHPSDPRAGEAAVLIGQAMNEAGQTDAAAAFLRSFAQAHPTDANASKALWNAIQYLQSNAEPTSATAAGDQLVAGFPTSSLAPQAAFVQGWNAYQRLDFSTARAIWQSVLDRWPDNPGSPPALLWLGKVAQRAGEIDLALKAYDLAWQANPGDYYAFRAKELSNSLKSVGQPLVPPPTDSPEHERAQFETWLATWTRADAAATSRPYVGATLAQGTTLARIDALVKIGLRDQAITEFQAAMKQFNDDGRSLYALADVTSRAGLSRESMIAAYRLLMMSPAPNSYQAPTFLQRLVYPYPYRQLIEASAAKYDIDPLLLVALMRQESAFDPRAQSSAGAVGLTQFMPSTAIGVANVLGMRDFRLEDIYQPKIAIEFAAAYLSAEIKIFKGNPYFALAAYNAGEGNVVRWLSDNPRRDVDLFVDEIPYQETREYVRNIYRFYQQYQYLYRSAPAR